MDKSHKLTVTKVDTFQGEIYDSWVFFFHEVVFCEPLVMDNNIWWKLLTIEPSQLTPRFLRVINNVSADLQKIMRSESIRPGY
jgi:hypothetical protein